MIDDVQEDCVELDAHTSEKEEPQDEGEDAKEAEVASKDSKGDGEPWEPNPEHSLPVSALMVDKPKAPVQVVKGRSLVFRLRERDIYIYTHI